MNEPGTRLIVLAYKVLSQLRYKINEASCFFIETSDGVYIANPGNDFMKVIF